MSLTCSQTAILDPISDHCCFLEFDIGDVSEIPDLKKTLSGLTINESLLIGFGSELLVMLGANVPGMHAYPDFSNGGIDIPRTQGALLVGVRGDSRGEIALRAIAICASLEPWLSLVRQVEGFKYDIGRDLTGYEDGTENPEDEEAVAAAILEGAGDGLNGSSFLAVQQWEHDFAAFHAMTPEQQDDAIGRHRESNEEFDAPSSAHVKRTAQEDFDPEAFVVRRSMPWSENGASGLYFVAFGSSFYAFEAQMRRMTGHDDGITDGLFEFSRPISGSYYWCPPVSGDGNLDLSALD